MPLSSELANKLAEYARNYSQNFTKSGGYIQLNGVSLAKASPSQWRSLLAPLSLTAEEVLEAATSVDSVTACIKQALKERANAEDDEIDLTLQLVSGVEDQFLLKDCEVFFSLKEAKYILLYDTEKKISKVMSVINFDKHTVTRTNAATKSEIKRRTKAVEFIYCPELEYGPHRLTDEQLQKHNPRWNREAFNVYQKPTYLALSPNAEPKLHPKIKQLMYHLFDCKGDTPSPSYMYMLQWLYYLLFKPSAKIPTLILCGDAGLGKNQFCEHLLKALIGETNFNDAPEDTSRFLSFFENCQIVFFDESTLNKKRKTLLKKLHDGRLATERKGQEIDGTKRIYSRVVISSNDHEDFLLTMDDRKFSVLDLTKVKFSKVFTDEDYEFFTTIHTQHQILAEFRAWIKAAFEAKWAKTFKPSESFKGRTYAEMCRSAFPNWFERLLQLLEEKEEITMMTLRRERISGFSMRAIESKLNEYDSQFRPDGFKSAEFVKEGNTTKLRSNIYKPHKEEEEEEDR